MATNPVINRHIVNTMARNSHNAYRGVMEEYEIGRQNGTLTGANAMITFLQSKQNTTIYFSRLVNLVIRGYQQNELNIAAEILSRFHTAIHCHIIVGFVDETLQAGREDIIRYLVAQGAIDSSYYYYLINNVNYLETLYRLGLPLPTLNNQEIIKCLYEIETSDLEEYGGRRLYATGS